LGVLIFKNSNLFAQTFANHIPVTPFIVLSTTESTNNYAMAKLHAGIVQHGTCFFAVEQTQGRGQRGRQWLSDPGDNITMSIIYAPIHNVSANVVAFPFLLSAIMALGCYDFIKDYGIQDVSIKWPNDLYIGDRKAAGILIDNIYKGSAWLWSVVGTGVNINQEIFPEDASRAVSLKMLTGTHYNSINAGKLLFHFLSNRLDKFQLSSADEIMSEYNLHLYRRGAEVKLKKDNIIFTALISHVTANGELITSAGTEQAFNVGEVEFI
jgi:BirA family biotin operon repressor/biotin-[acetyl-CoA-carboxylase] ligase